MDSTDPFSAQLQELQNFFRSQLATSLPEMRSAWRAFKEDTNLEHAKVMIGFVHRLAGTAGTIGFGELGERAAAIEIAIRSVSEGGSIPEDVAQDVTVLFGMIADLTAGSDSSEVVPA